MLWDDDIKPTKKGKKKEEEDAPIQRKAGDRRRHSELFVTSTRHDYRRAFSELSLIDSMNGREFEDGHSYHFISAGDVDSFSYLKLILRHQPKLKYCLLSTWCISAEDILDIRELLESGKIERLDCYVGEIFPSSYKVEFKMLSTLMEEFGGRLCVFRNHSKIYAGFGDDFYFSIETSANVNTNPRTEQGCITIDKGLFEFYKAYFDGINSFV